MTVVAAFPTVAAMKCPCSTGKDYASCCEPIVTQKQKAKTAEQRLAYYATHFPLVEVDATYYSPPAESTTRLWAQRTPEGFLFNIKAFSLLTGILGTATVVGAFLVGWPSIIAVILNYVKRSEARGTWLESHFRWQIRTFWFGLLWVALCILFIIITLGIGALIAWIPMLGVGFWFIYRILRGWMALNDNRPMYR